MIPGGFIESRDFSHINSMILAIFNIFLTILGLISLFLVYFINKNFKWSFKAAYLCGISYFTVYIIDLFKIFPKSPTPMPELLYILEIVGCVISIPLIFYSMKIIKEWKNDDSKMTFSKGFYGLIAIAVIIGLCIIIFATNAAMTGK
ncbi:hypothetical protein SAMN05421846_101179 [Chryseobacterium taeanense]|uniref:DUF8051 domain-containing protein n=2 Tax=Chryseobacterium taeanense TaxID=311334 RepID=A0A1G8DGP7_9FLAO|nr:hypothetical protein SAMN05421846_101179 [Chryseobacterium taeanense]